MAQSRLHIEAIGGVAGDMLLAALIDLGADANAIRDVFASLGLPGLALDVSRVSVNGVAACYVRSMAPHEGHVHRHLSEIVEVIDRAAMSEAAKQRARATFELLAQAEATVHGGTATEVHLHEVGELDSIMDVVGIAVALDLLGNPPLTASPLPSGEGTVASAHGELVVPVPAVVEIAGRHQVPLAPAALRGETVTPTGIAIVAQGVSAFCDAPSISMSVGVGAGTRRFPDRPNIVLVHRAALREAQS